MCVHVHGCVPLLLFLSCVSASRVRGGKGGEEEILVPSGDAAQPVAGTATHARHAGVSVPNPVRPGPATTLPGFRAPAEAADVIAAWDSSPSQAVYPPRTNGPPPTRGAPGTDESAAMQVGGGRRSRKRAQKMSPPARQFERRSAIGLTTAALLKALLPQPAWSADKAYLPALEGKDYGKAQMSYEDFTKTDSGLMYKDATVGIGASPVKGDRVVVDWSGFTIGFQGRPFETKQLAKLDGLVKDPIRFELGRGLVVPGMEEGLLSMKEGGVRQLVITPELGYPPSDPDHKMVGPRPATFSGQRALNFVLYNRELLDKTLLINVKLVRVDKPGQNNWQPGRPIPTDGFWQ